MSINSYIMTDMITTMTFNPTDPDMAWRKSTRCESHTCVEVATTTTAQPARVRDGKLGADSPILAFSGPSWTAFVGSLR